MWDVKYGDWKLPEGREENMHMPPQATAGAARFRRCARCLRYHGVPDAIYYDCRRPAGGLLDHRLGRRAGQTEHGCTW